MVEATARRYNCKRTSFDGCGKTLTGVQAAPGKVSTTANGWSADNTKAAFLGMTAHWIEVKDDKWELRSEVVGFQGISGGHDGNNLGRYFMGLCDRVGICGPTESKVRRVLPCVS
jgi:hypothetical protein